MGNSLHCPINLNFYKGNLHYIRVLIFANTSSISKLVVLKKSANYFVSEMLLLRFLVAAFS